MSDHADTIRRHFEPGFTEDDKVLAALDALLAENQRLRDALEQIAQAQHIEWAQALREHAAAALAAVRAEDER